MSKQDAGQLLERIENELESQSNSAIPAVNGFPHPSPVASASVALYSSTDSFKALLALVRYLLHYRSLLCRLIIKELNQHPTGRQYGL